MKKGIALVALVALVAVATPTSALVAERDSLGAQNAIAIITRAVECTSKTFSGGDNWEWYVGGQRDPVQPGAYYTSSWSGTQHYTAKGNGCVLTSFTCSITVFDGGFTRPNSQASVQWVSGGTSTSSGTYKGIAFSGGGGWCDSSSVYVYGTLAHLTGIYGHSV